MTPDPRYTPVDLDLRPLGAFGRFFADYAWVAAGATAAGVVSLSGTAAIAEGARVSGTRRARRQRQRAFN